MIKANFIVESFFQYHKIINIKNLIIRIVIKIETSKLNLKEVITSIQLMTYFDIYDKHAILGFGAMELITEY